MAPMIYLQVNLLTKSLKDPKIDYIGKKLGFHTRFELAKGGAYISQNVDKQYYNHGIIPNINAKQIE